MRAAALLPLAVLSLLWGIAQAIDSEPPLPDAAQRERYEKLVHEVRCLVCQNQTIGDSTAPLAADLRREIRRMVSEGRSEGEIKTFLIDRYGDFVLYRPRFQRTTLLLWLAPALLVAIGAVAMVRIVRRRARLPADVDADETAPGGQSQ
jgi:cytochrome c-type biogenesis protein CcmH